MNRLALISLPLFSTLACSDIRVPIDCPIGAICDVEANFAFVTSEAYVPFELNGLDGADKKCQDLADRSLEVPPGNYIAWLSDSDSSVLERMENTSGWLRLDGRPFALSKADLLEGKIVYPLNIQDNGATLTEPMDGVVLTGTAAIGEAKGDDCAGFTQSVPNDSPQLGFALSDGETWTEAPMPSGGATTCDQKARLYCLGTDHDTVLKLPKVPSNTRFAWVSKAKFKGDTTVDVMDEACDSEANEDGNQFEAKAFVAAGGEPAAIEFETTGTTWARPDGVVLWEKASDFMNPPLAPIGLLLDEERTDSLRVWTGAVAPGVKPNPTGAGNCEDWSSSASSAEGRVGFPTQIGELFFSAARKESCDREYPVYCLEN